MATTARVLDRTGQADTAAAPEADIALARPRALLRPPAEADTINLRTERPDVGPKGDAIRVAQRLREARQRLFPTQLVAAQQLGIKHSTYAAHENGHRKLRWDICEFYAREFGISTDWLFYGREPMLRRAEPAEAEAGDLVPGGLPAGAGRAPTRAAGAGDMHLVALLRQLKVRQLPEGGLVPQDPADREAPFPPLHNGGYVLELAPLAETPGECIVFHGALRFALRDIHRLPAHMLDRGRMALVKCPANGLLPEPSGDQLLLVDLDARGVDAPGGVFAMSKRGRDFFPALLTPGGEPARPVVMKSPRRSQPIAALADDEEVIGRIVGVIKKFGHQEMDDLVESLLERRAAA